MESRMVLIEYGADHLSFRCPGRCYPGYLRGDEGFHRGHVSLVVTEELKGQLIPQGFLYCASCSYPLERVVTFREGRSSFVTRHHGGQLLLTRPGPGRAHTGLGSFTSCSDAGGSWVWFWEAIRAVLAETWEV